MINYKSRNERDLLFQSSPRLKALQRLSPWTPGVQVVLRTPEEKGAVLACLFCVRCLVRDLPSHLCVLSLCHPSVSGLCTFTAESLQVSSRARMHALSRLELVL